jgi:tRNA-specific 2-thiouridylase
MVEGYRSGLTPNPDVMCNREIKFGLFLKRALEAGADYVATGHYVRLKNRSLFEAVDQHKDQSYFLWTLTQKQLSHCLFPIGDYEKPEVRAMARKAGLQTADKKDSQGICFLGQVSIADFLKQYISEERGLIVTVDGKKVGEHNGAYVYTIGQRHGLDLKVKNRELGIRGNVVTQPHYVVGKDVLTNTVIVAEGANNEALTKKSLELANVNIINPRKSFTKKNLSHQVMARVRYRQPITRAQLTITDKETTHLTFEKPQKFVAPGQSAVFYSSAGEMLGGGVII